MKTVGIIAEYNPFHNGHLYHIAKAKEITNSDFCIVIMSGNFVQRGDIAIIDKYTRTEMALRNGADLVIELPVYFSTSSAYYFSMASVALLDRLNIVDNLCFGSESGNLSDLAEIANILSNEDEVFKSLLKSQLSTGVSFPSARNNALKLYGVENFNLIQNPNNILSIEYLKALNLLGSNIKPFTITRETAPYHETSLTGEISSATSIRNALKDNHNNFKTSVPDNTLDLWERELNLNNSPVYLDSLSNILRYIICTKSPSELHHILDISEGLENKLISTFSENYTISQIVSGLKSKRYTQTKLQRALIHILLDITKNDFEYYVSKGFSQYIRILGFRKESSILLNQIEKKASLPLITNLKYAKNVLDENSLFMLNKEIMSTDIYNLAREGKLYPKNYEYKTPLVII